MEIILDMWDIRRSSSGINHNALGISDFATLSREAAYMARKITYVHGKERIVLKDRENGMQRRSNQRPVRTDWGLDLLSECETVI